MSASSTSARRAKLELKAVYSTAEIAAAMGRGRRTVWRMFLDADVRYLAPGLVTLYELQRVMPQFVASLVVAAGATSTTIECPVCGHEACLDELL